MHAETQATLGTLRSDGGPVTIATDLTRLRDGLERGVVSAEGDRRVRPADGYAFLDAVLVSYSGSYVYAVEEPT